MRDAIEQVKKRRRMLGLTQHQLADLSKVPVSRIAYAETGRTKLTLEEVQRIKEALAKRAEAVSTMVST